MGTIPGFFIDRSLSPRVLITARGTWTSSEFEAILDTGFEGLAAFPIPQAMPIGLTLDGDIKSVLADGTEVLELTAKVTVEFGTKSILGSVILTNAGEVLVGMDFLRVFNLSLILHRDQVLLIPNATLDPILPGLH